MFARSYRYTGAKTISAGVNMLIEKNEQRTNVFLKHLFDKISNIFERN